MNLSDLEIFIETACKNCYTRVWRPEYGAEFIKQKMGEYVDYLNKKIDAEIDFEKELEENA